jgi:hypothetical protein
MTTVLPNDAVVAHRGDVETLGHLAIATLALLADGTHTAGAVSVVRVTLGQGVDGAKAHHHARSAELFFLIRTLLLDQWPS